MCLIILGVLSAVKILIRSTLPSLISRNGQKVEGGIPLTLRHLLTQTLTTLDLNSNKIGQQGAQHLANALQQNKVSTTLLLLLLNT
jgi:hypothetical protein